MEFYYPDGSKINSKEEFLSFYSKCYYLTNSKYVEDKIEELIQKDKLEKDDIFKIMAWKTGKINHKESDQNKKFVYHKSWNSETYKNEVYGKELDIGEIHKSLGALKEMSIKEVLAWPTEKGLIGIGPVYAITLWYFVTKGDYPIFDRFADKAILAICGETVKERSVTKEVYKDYFEKIKGVFFKEYDERKDNPGAWRRVDQALWSYGHLF